MAAIDPMGFSTPDLCDKYPSDARVLDAIFINYGGVKTFSGEIVTIKCFEDNSIVKEQAARNGKGKVMVVDGGGSLRRALLGDMIAREAVKNNWSGFVIYGCIRDVDIIASLGVGVKALNVNPVKTEKRGIGDLGVPLSFAGQVVHPGEYIYADNNGIIISKKFLD